MTPAARAPEDAPTDRDPMIAARKYVRSCFRIMEQDATDDEIETVARRVLAALGRAEYAESAHA